MEEVKSSVLIWPPPNQVEVTGRKDTLIRHLDRIAEKMGTLRPETRVVQAGERIPENCVLKRTHSDSGQHVILPGKDTANVDFQQGPRDAVWLCQEFVSTLRDVGEWRVVIINKSIQYVVHTLPQQGTRALSSKLVHGYFSLDEWR
jgi:hypothetical protein